MSCRMELCPNWNGHGCIRGVIDSCDDSAEPVYGMCRACGSVEVLLTNATGRHDFSGIGESHAYPTGYGCEVCA